MKRIILLFLILPTLLFAEKTKLYQPYNMDFEQGITKYGEPLGWSITVKQFNKGYRDRLDSNSHNGRYGVALYNDADTITTKDRGVLLQTIDATPFRGRNMVFSTFLKTKLEKLKGFATIFIEFSNYSTGLLASYTNTDDSTVASDWTEFSVAGKTPIDADEISYGIVLKGIGKIYADDAKLITTDKSDSQNVASLELSQFNIASLKFFSQLYGLAKYNYPAKFDETFDWPLFLTKSVESVLSAKNSSELKETLNAIITPINPNIIISDINAKTPKLIDFSSANDLYIKAHSIIFENKSPTIGSKIINVNLPQRGVEGALMQNVNPSDYKGQELTIEFSAKLIADNKVASAQFNVDMDRSGELVGIDSLKTPITKPTWNKYSLKTKILDSAASIKLGLVLSGEGSAYFSNIVVKNSDGKVIKFLRNGSFEEKIGGKPSGWVMVGASTDAGYYCNVENNEKGESCIRIYSDTAKKFNLPQNYYSIVEGKECGLKAFFPIAAELTTEKIETPIIMKNFAISSKKDSTFIPNINDAYSRIASLIEANEILNKFEFAECIRDKSFPFDVLLSQTAESANQEVLVKSIKELYRGYNDGALAVWANEIPQKFIPPFDWMLAENKIIIKYSQDAGLAIGDEIISIDGKPAQTVLQEFKSQVNGGTENWKNVRALALIQGGEKDSDLNLQVKKTNGEIVQIAAKRNLSITEFSEPKIESFSEIAPGVLYINLTGISERAFSGKFDLFTKAKKVIFDARGTVELQQVFYQSLTDKRVKKLKIKMPIYSFVNADTLSYYSEQEPLGKAKRALPADKYFLIDGRTNADIEYWLTLIKDNNLGKIVGEQSAGLAANPLAFRLPCHLNLSISREILLDKDDQIINEKGVSPDIPAHYTIKGLQEGNDDILNAAINN